jgi:hypothetical protein
MMRTSPHYFFTRRVAIWEGEREFLERSLACEPDAAQAWWWKLRLRVLEFVVARYGADPVVRARDHAPEPHATGADLTFGERRTIEPRPRAALGAHLQSIAEANDFPRPPAPPDDDDRVRQKRIEMQSIAILGFVAITSTAATVAIAVEAGGRILIVTIAFLMGCATILFGVSPLFILAGRWLKKK